MYGCMHAFSCFGLSCVGRGLVVDRFHEQGFLPDCLKGFMVSEVNSESEQARGQNSRKAQTTTF